MDRLNLYNHILLNEGAYFFKSGREPITDRKMKQVFDEVLEGLSYKILTRIVRQKELITSGNGETQALCSLLVFRHIALPSMFDFDEDNCPSKLKEAKISYLLIVEMGEYVVIVKKNISHLSKFINSLIAISAKTIASVLVNNGTDFQQIKLANMNTGKNAIRSKSFEANNLQISMPMFGTNQSIVTTVRFANDDGVCSINIGTSRIAKFGNKRGMTALLAWMRWLVDKIDDYNDVENFLSRFALPKNWKDVEVNLLPTSLLINIFDLQNYIEERLDDKTLYKKTGKDSYKPFTHVLCHLFRKGIESLDLKESNNKQFINESVGVCKLVNGIHVVTLGAWDTLYYKDNNNKYVKIKTLINSLHCFNVCFTDYSYVYAYGKLYRNAEIDKDFDAILSVLEPIDEISGATSEKGENYTIDDKEFKEGSLFYVVEKHIFSEADILICDDMGNEWADHIALKDNTLSFVHSKCNEEGLSASKFQDVIGQAIKNIGNIQPNEAELDKKISSMRGKWCNTGIDKCRRGDINNFKSTYQHLMRNPNKVREVCLAVNFLSKESLTKAFDKLKQGKTFKQRNSVIQLVWLLNGFISTCKQADFNCRIFCKK